MYSYLIVEVRSLFSTCSNDGSTIFRAETTQFQPEMHIVTALLCSMSYFFNFAFKKVPLKHVCPDSVKRFLHSAL